MNGSVIEEKILVGKLCCPGGCDFFHVVHGQSPKQNDYKDLASGPKGRCSTFPCLHVFVLLSCMYVSLTAAAIIYVYIYYLYFVLR